MKILIIDNYDSFTYNLHHYLEDIVQDDVDVLRNDDPLISDLEKYSHLVFSPGPGLPANAGQMMQIIQQYASEKPMLGICLGMQAMAEVYGGKLINLDHIVHGAPDNLHSVDASDLLYQGIDGNIQVGRYHSWIVDPTSVEKDFYFTSFGQNDILMSFRHKTLPIYGVQYHPESILTPHGKMILANFIQVKC